MADARIRRCKSLVAALGAAHEDPGSRFRQVPTLGPMQMIREYLRHGFLDPLAIDPANFPEQQLEELVYNLGHYAEAVCLTPNNHIAYLNRGTEGPIYKYDLIESPLLPPRLPNFSHVLQLPQTEMYCSVIMHLDYYETSLVFLQSQLQHTLHYKVSISTLHLENVGEMSANLTASLVVEFEFENHVHDFACTPNPLVFLILCANGLCICSSTGVINSYRLDNIDGFHFIQIEPQQQNSDIVEILCVGNTKTAKFYMHSYSVLTIAGEQHLYHYVMARLPTESETYAFLSFGLTGDETSAWFLRITSGATTIEREATSADFVSWGDVNVYITDSGRHLVFISYSYMSVSVFSVQAPTVTKAAVE
jgi:hypothetical protein